MSFKAALRRAAAVRLFTAFTLLSVATGAAAPLSAEQMEIAALRGMVEEQAREIAELRAGGGRAAATTTTTKSQRSSLPMTAKQQDANMAPMNGVTTDLTNEMMLEHIAKARDSVLGMEGHPGEELLQGRRHLQQGDPTCSNVGEVSWGPLFLGSNVCGHMVASVWGHIDHTCSSYMCDDDVNGTGLCVVSGFCNAMCGFCAREPQAELSLGQNISVEVTATDSPNNPNYHNLTVTVGQTYRVRAFPDLESESTVRGMLLIVRNPAGEPIRRAVSSTGNVIRDLSTAWSPRTPTQLEAEPRDVEMGCVGASHIDIVFKATMEGVYSIGLSQATDVNFARTENMSVHEYTMQWRGQLHPFMDPNHPLLDMAQLGGLSYLGAPANGTLTLLVDDVTATLPPLPGPEQVAMEELRSVEHGIGIPSYVWDQNAHPCSWGGEQHSGLSPSCCLSDDAAGNLQAASISAIDTNIWWNLHRGAHDTSEFVGTIPNSIVNLTSLRQLHVGPSQISGTIPAGLATLPLVRLAIDNTQQWGELPEVSSTMEHYMVRSVGYISGTVPDSLGAVDSLRGLWLTGMERLSGTFPSLCGHEGFVQLIDRNTPQISGTIHDLPHADHPSHAYNNGSCFMSQGIGNIVLAHNKLSGSISERWACAQNGTSSFTANTMVAQWNTLMTGTMPTCMFDGATRLTLGYFPFNKYTGQIPNLNLSTLVYGMRFEGNDFQQFPDAFPSSLRMFKANDNPRMLASGAEVAQMLQTAPYLNDFSVTVDNTLATSIARGGGGIGPLPDLGWTEMKPTLPLDCRFGEPCGFMLELVIGIDYVPLRSIGVNFVVHMSDSPIDLDDQIVGIGHLISNTSEHWSGTFNTNGGGRRRAQEYVNESEQVGNAESLGDTLTGEVGHFASHLGTLNLTRTITMLDTDDGYVSTVLPVEWFSQSGRYNFRIFGTTNYCEANVSGVVETLPPGSCDTDPRCDCSAHKEQLLEFYDKSLWFVNMHPIVCHDPLATPNAAGSTCQCPPGSAPSAPCEPGDSYCECFRCSDYGDTSYSDDGLECKQCAIREVSNADATGCQCGAQFYNASNGLITCHDQDVIADVFQTSDAYKVPRDQRASTQCIECPSCIDCTTHNDPPRIRAGFHLSDDDVKSDLWFNSTVPQERRVIRCRPESLENDDIKDELLKALSENTLESSISSGTMKGWFPTDPQAICSGPTDPACYPDEHVQCLGTPIVNGTRLKLTCAYGHTGTACGKCKVGFGKKNENQCVPCGEALKLESILTLSATITGILLILGIIMILLSFWVGDVYGEHLGKFKGHVSDLDADLAALLLKGQGGAQHSNPLHESGDDASANDKELDVHLRTLFQRVDANHSGHIDRDEVAEMSRSLGHYMTKAELDTSMTLMDPNGDGLVTFEEFSAWIKARNAADGGGLFPVVQVSLSTLFKTSQGLLLSVGSMSIQPLKLFISYWQIAAQIGPVLHFNFPPQMAALIKVFKPFVAAIHGFVALECAGLSGGFYLAWLFEVFVIPLTLWGIVGAYYFVRRSTLGVKEANAKSSDDALFVLFCVYPMMSNKFFKMLNCRDLGTQNVIASDYNVDCEEPQHRHYEYIAITMIVVFSFGIPIGMMLIMANTQKQRRKEYNTPEWNYIARRVATQLAHDNVSDIKNTLIDISLGTVYGSLVNAYRPGNFYWECFDMIRKLLLVGMLTLVQQGSVIQICTGLATSAVFFAAHIRALPFRHIEDNVLKATTEAHLFIMLVVVLTMKTGLENEVFGEDFYDMVCTILFIIFVPVAAFICIAHKWHTVVSHNIDAVDHNTHTQCLQAAFQRHRLGRDKAEDRLLLAEYLEKLEDEVKSDYHVFISYRVATEAALAKKLYEELSQMTLAETGQKLRVYLDQERLEDGERWDSGFMEGLGASWIVVPIVSAGSLTPMGNLFDEGGNPVVMCDNVLLEWTATLELFSRQEVKAVMPIIACSEDGSEFAWGLPKTLSDAEHEPTLTATKKHLRRHPSSLYLPSESTTLTGVSRMVHDVTNSVDNENEQEAQVSVSGVISAVLRFQGILLTDRNDLKTCNERIFNKATALLNRGGSADGTEAAAEVEDQLHREQVENSAENSAAGTPA